MTRIAAFEPEPLYYANRVLIDPLPRRPIPPVRAGSVPDENHGGPVLIDPHPITGSIVGTAGAAGVTLELGAYCHLTGIAALGPAGAYYYEGEHAFGFHRELLRELAAAGFEWLELRAKRSCRRINVHGARRHGRVQPTLYGPRVLIPVPMWTILRPVRARKSAGAKKAPAPVAVQLALEPELD